MFSLVRYCSVEYCCRPVFFLNFLWLGLTAPCSIIKTSTSAVSRLSSAPSSVIASSYTCAVVSHTFVRNPETFSLASLRPLPPSTPPNPWRLLVCAMIGVLSRAASVVTSFSRRSRLYIWMSSLSTKQSRSNALLSITRMLGSSASLEGASSAKEPRRANKRSTASRRRRNRAIANRRQLLSTRLDSSMFINQGGCQQKFAYNSPKLSLQFAVNQPQTRGAALRLNTRGTAQTWPFRSTEIVPLKGSTYPKQ
jgi:hypothetical protein